jgi:glycosyltransferase involved in cell wall biosynthesis
VGRVPYDEVANYYAATDIGLYPAVGGTYDDGRSPIKVFEFTACGVPVVAAPIREIQRLAFKNVCLAEANEDGFAEGILTARSCAIDIVPDVERYDWTTIAARLESIIEECQSNHP